MRRLTTYLIQWHFVTFLHLKRLQYAGNIARKNASFVPKTLTGRCFGCKRHLWKPRNRWEDGAFRADENLLHLRQWKAAASKRGSWKS